MANLLHKVKSEFSVVEFKSSMFERFLIKLYSLLSFNEKHLDAISVNPFLPAKTRKSFESASCNYIISIGQASLYWIYKTDPACLKKTIHYSLEVQKISDPYFITPAFANILKWETRLLKKIKGLIIQDVFRAEALLNCKMKETNLIFFFVPVAILSNEAPVQANYLHRQLNIPKDKNIILYFGAVYTERYLREIAENFDKHFNNSWVLVLHGPDTFSDITRNNKRIQVSNNLLDFDDLHLIMSSAKVGLALYDNGWPNTRFTAFSSEKIARYLEVGVPFIAFENESYHKLKKEFNCCELIKDISHLSAAVEKIMNDYEAYQANCHKAFSKYYNISNSLIPLTNFVKTKTYTVAI